MHLQDNFYTNSYVKENLGKSKAKVQTRSMLKELVKETTRLSKYKNLQIRTVVKFLVD